MCGGGGSDSGAAARQAEIERQNRIATGQQQINETFGQFNDAFYNQRQQDYTKFAMPQLYRQLGQTNTQGMYGLANRGLANSGAADRFGSQLTQEANTQKQGIVDAGIAQAQQLRKDVEGQRSALFAQLQSSADPTNAAQQALATAGAYSLPSSFAPIGNLFANFAQMYAINQISKAYSPQNYTANYGLNNPAIGARSYSLR